MKITTCYTVPIKRQLTTAGPAKGERKITGSRPVNDTLMRRTADLCLDALKFCVDAFLSEWGYLSSLPVAQKAGVMSRRRAADLMVHSTKDNNARYQDFDRLSRTAEDAAAHIRYACITGQEHGRIKRRVLLV